MIAMALSCEPELLIADEPTTALDVTIQAQILAEIEDLRRETGVAVLLITHDLGVVAEVASRVVVMYAGRSSRSRASTSIFKDPLHPYTWGLLGSIPRIDTARAGAAADDPGSPPSLLAPPRVPLHDPRARTGFDQLRRRAGLQRRRSPASIASRSLPLSLQDKRRLRWSTVPSGLPAAGGVEA